MTTIVPTGTNLFVEIFTRNIVLYFPYLCYSVGVRRLFYLSDRYRREGSNLDSFNWYKESNGTACKN